MNPRSLPLYHTFSFPVLTSCVETDTQVNISCWVMLAQTLSVWSGYNRSFQAGVASFCWFLKSGNHPNFSRTWRGRRSLTEHHPLWGEGTLVMTRNPWWHKVPCPNVITLLPLYLEFILRGLSKTRNPTFRIYFCLFLVSECLFLCTIKPRELLHFQTEWMEFAGSEVWREGCWGDPDTWPRVVGST